MSKLKACPLCGNKANLPKWFATNPEGFGIECSNRDCCEGIYGYDTEKEAIEAWQFRPIEDAQSARIAELEKRNARLEQAGDAMNDPIEQDDKLVCRYCGEWSYRWETKALIHHTPECKVTAWLRAKEGKE